MASYRKLERDFWTDSDVQEMLHTGKHLEVLFFNYAITGYLACNDKAISGIYEISRGLIQSQLGITKDQIDSILTYFNQNKSRLIEYDFDNHMIFVKNLYKYNSDYKPKSSKLASLMECFEKTYEKAPNFWIKFSLKYQSQLEKTLNFLDIGEGNFIEKEFILKLLSLHRDFHNSPIQPQLF